jgi:hypothetical protein
MNVKILVLVLFCFYFIFAFIKSSNVEKVLIIEPYFDFNQYLDDPYTRKVPESPKSMISNLLKRSFQLFTFSLKTSQGTISALRIQLCMSNTLKHILKETEKFNDYKLILENIQRRLKSDPVVTEIFNTKAIDRLIQIFRVYMVISYKTINENIQIFLKGLEFGVKLIKWMLKEITCMEPDSFDEFLRGFLSEPNSFDDFASDFLEKLKNEKDLVSNDSKIEFNCPSTTIATLQMIQSIKRSIDEAGGDLDFGDFSVYFDESLISDLKNINPNHLNTILKYSEYEIRKDHDYNLFDSRVITLDSVSKKPALKKVEDNLKRFVNYFKNTRIPNLEIVLLLKSITKTEFKSREIKLISCSIQELLSNDSMMRRHCLHEEPYDFESFEDNVKVTIRNLIKYLRTLGSEVEIDKFLRLIYDFLSEESIKTIKEVLKKFSELVKSGEETLFCLGLGLTGDFDLMKEYVLNNLLQDQDLNDELNVNHWLKNLTNESSMENLSTIRKASDKSSSNNSDLDSDDASFFNEVEEGGDFNEYFTFNYNDRRNHPNSYLNYFDFLIDTDDNEYYI